MRPLEIDPLEVFLGQHPGLSNQASEWLERLKQAGSNSARRDVLESIPSEGETYRLMRNAIEARYARFWIWRRGRFSVVS